MSEYRRGQMVTRHGSAYIADATTSGVPGEDPAWRLLARGVPAPVTEGNVLTVQDGRWQEAEPTGGGGGGGVDLADAWAGDWVQP